MSKRVAIVGLGAMGSMAAWRLTQGGATVVGFDKFAPPHDRGGHAGESRLFRAAYLEGPQYVPYLLRSRKGWEELQQVAGTNLFHPSGILSVGRPEDDYLHAIELAASMNDLPLEFLGEKELQGRFPQFRFRGDEIGLLDGLGGLIEPERAVEAALNAASSAGAVLHMNTPVTQVLERSDHVELVVGEERMSFDHVVVTAGAWSSTLLGDAFSTIVPTQLFLTWFLAKDASLFHPSRFPGSVLKAGGMDDLPLGIVVFPSLDGKTVKVGESIGGQDGISSPELISRFIEPERLQRLSECVAEYLPSLRPSPVRVGVYVDGYSPDSRPLMAASDRVTSLAGFSGHGFKFAPVVGEIAARSALEGDLDDAEPMFAVQRLSSPFA